MNQVRIDTGKAALQIEQFRSISNKLERSAETVQRAMVRLRYNKAGFIPAAYRRLAAVRSSILDKSEKAERLAEVLQGIMEIYDRCEASNKDISIYPSDSFPVNGVIGGIAASGEIMTRVNAGWLGYEMNEDNSAVTAWIGKASAEAEGEWGYAGVNAYLGKVEAASTAKWERNSDGNLILAEVGLAMSATLASVDGKVHAGNDMLGADIEGRVDVGTVKMDATGKFSIGKDGVNANLEAGMMVAAVEGKASGSINILGLEITGKVSGYAGAAGVEGKIGIEDNKLVAKAGVAALLGFSGEIEIGFNDEGWNDFVDFITFWD